MLCNNCKNKFILYLEYTLKLFSIHWLLYNTLQIPVNIQVILVFFCYEIFFQLIINIFLTNFKLYLKYFELSFIKDNYIKDNRIRSKKNNSSADIHYYIISFLRLDWYIIVLYSYTLSRMKSNQINQYIKYYNITSHGLLRLYSLYHNCYIMTITL